MSKESQGGTEFSVLGPRRGLVTGWTRWSCSSFPTSVILGGKVGCALQVEGRQQWGKTNGKAPTSSSPVLWAVQPSSHHLAVVETCWGGNGSPPVHNPHLELQTPSPLAGELSTRRCRSGTAVTLLLQECLHFLGQISMWVTPYFLAKFLLEFCFDLCLLLVRYKVLLSLK